MRGCVDGLRARSAEDRGDRPALDPLRRGRPHPASVYPGPRAAGGDRQGRAPVPQPVRRPARAVLPHPRHPARGSQRAADGHGVDTIAAHAGAARARRARSTPRRAPATRWRGCSRPPTRIPRCSACSPTSWRCSTATPRTRGPANGLAFRLKLLLAAGIVPQLGACAGVRRVRASAGLFGRGRRRRLQLLRGGRVPARRGVLRVPRRRARAAAGRGARRLRARAARRPSARSPRPPSTTRTCGCGRCSRRRSRPRSTSIARARLRPGATVRRFATTSSRAAVQRPPLSESKAMSDRS